MDLLTIALIKLSINNDYYSRHKKVESIRELEKKELIEKIPATEYYTLYEFYEKKDREFEYLLLDINTIEDLINLGLEYGNKYPIDKDYNINLKVISDLVEPLKNLNFLCSVGEILQKLEDYEKNTYRNYIISICSALSFETSKKFKKAYETYYNILVDLNKQIKEKEKEGEGEKVEA